MRLGGALVLLREGGGDQRRDDAPSALAGMGERVAHEVHAAALPGGVHHFGDGGLQPLMRVGDDELDAAQSPPAQAAQELGPEGLGLRGACIHSENFTTSIGVDADGDDRRHRDDAAVLARLHIGGVDPQIGPVALERSLEKGVEPSRRSPGRAG